MLQDATTASLLQLAPSSSPSSAAAESPKKRACEEKSLPLSNKKTKDTDGGGAAADGLRPNEHRSDADVTDNHQSDKRAAAESFHELESTEKTDSEPNAKQSDERTSIRYGATTNNDVLISSGVSLTDEGNRKYRALVDSKKALYQVSNRGVKASIVTAIICEWRSQIPPGRFLKPDFSKSMIWNDIGDEAARFKIAVALGRKPKKKQRQREIDESNGAAVSFSDEDKPRGNEKNTAIENGDTKPASSTTVSNNGNEGIVKHKKNESNQKSSSAAKQGKVSASAVRPHDTDSMYNDVLSFFTSTPFNAESMLSLHEQKERSIMRESLTLPSRASLPIISQKQFMNTKAPAQQNVHNDQERPKSSPYVEREVSKFLLVEAKHLVNMALPTKKSNGQPLQHNSYSSSTATSPTLHQCSVAKLGGSQVNAPLLKHLDGTVAPVSRNGQPAIAE
eukprot:CAMPEP_0172302868 /NCGR_PEP_ID=MMETSP1058-20130122/4519_1 /TAXON_ID=83371 /ORGANISM="Detonula confervacea, Strain CCMP 353" /LENGTH=449 /DNA_ID=CAMNT_0013013517 /DNA_START=220 /DNA_END=1566 /DNA_ORIENTATION=+